MSKKKVKCFCYDCDIGFTVQFEADDTMLEPEICPFCASAIEEEDTGADGEDDVESSSDEDENY